MTILTMTATVTTLIPHCNNYGRCHPTELQTTMCYVALYLVAIGSGAIRPCVSSFGADQFKETMKDKKSSFFNRLYVSVNVGMLIATSVVVWIQLHIGWGWGLGIPTIAMVVATACFFCGSKKYRRLEAEGSPLTRIIQVLAASCRKFKVHPPDESLLYETEIDENFKLAHTDGLRFFDKAAFEMPGDRIPDGLIHPWRLCTVTQVEELKTIIRLLPIWASGIVFAIVFSQMSSLFILQGNTMSPNITVNFSVPPASLSLFNALGVIVGTPIYDKVIVPYARRFSGHEQGLTQLQRLGIGLALSVLTMVTSAAMELVRLKQVRENNLFNVKFVPMSIFWQVPQYFVLGFAEVFAFVGELEFFYDQAPRSMRSVCCSLFLTTYAIGNYVSTILVNLVTRVTTRNGNIGWIPDNLNKGHLDYYYWLLAVLSLLNFFLYVCIAKGYTYKRVISHV